MGEPGARHVRRHSSPAPASSRRPVSLIVGRHSLSLNAFVIRHPDENEAGVHRWLLERNLKLYGVSYAVDQLGDVYVTGRSCRCPPSPPTSSTACSARSWRPPTAASTPSWSWASPRAIRKEYEWRVSRGESTRNLDAFTHLTQRATD